MTNIVTISKTGKIKTETVKKAESKNLYKKCKLRKDTDFAIRQTWKHKDYWVSIYAKDNGRAGSENKYDLPPPVDSVLYFGAMVLIKHTNEVVVDEEIQDFTKETWLKVYEKLMGGFEDLEEEEEEDDELDNIPDEFKTKEGYLKDGFVVSDDLDDYVSQSGDELEEHETDETDEANYGGETGEEEEEEEEVEKVSEEESEDDPASELSEEEYSY
jgi:hypothetical protein